MALFKILRGTSADLNNQPLNDGYAYFTPDDGRFYIDAQLDTAPGYYIKSGTVNGKNVYRIEIESKTWAELNNTKSTVGHHHTISDIDDFTDTTYTFSSPLSVDANNNVTLGTVPVSKGGTGVSTITSGQVLIGNGSSAITTRAIDTTSGGTSGSNALITSGAVYSGLGGKSEVGHHHTIAQIDDLAFDGTYNSSTNKVATVSTVSTAVASITASKLGLDKALKFIGFATVEVTDGSTVDPKISGYTTRNVGDVIIDSATHYEYVWTTQNKWERLGADGDFLVAGGTSISVKPTGKISNTGTTVNYTPTGSISAQTFSGDPASIVVTGTPTGTVAISTSTSGTKNYTPTGTISSGWSGTAGTVTVSGSTDGVGVSNHSYTPAGSITTTAASVTYTPTGSVSLIGMPTSIAVTGTTDGEVSVSTYTGSIDASNPVNFTPTGTISSKFKGDEGTVSVAGSTTGVSVSAHTYTPAGSITATTTGTANYTPEGTVTSTFKGSAFSSTGAYTPTGSVIRSTNAAVSTATVYSITGVGTTPELTMTVSNEVLSYGWSAGSEPTRSAVTVATGISTQPAFTFSGTAATIEVSGTATGTVSSSFSGTGTRLVFGGTQATLSHSVTQGTVTASGKFTPSGTVTSTFYGTGSRLLASFTGKSITSTGNFPTVTTSFKGDGAKLGFKGTTATISHSVTQGTVTASGNFTPQGTVTSTFYGDGVRLTGTLVGESFTATGNYTPTGSVSTASFTGDGAKLVFTGDEQIITI